MWVQRRKVLISRRDNNKFLCFKFLFISEKEMLLHLREFQLEFTLEEHQPLQFPLSAFCQSQMKLFEEKNYFFSSFLKMYNPWRKINEDFWTRYLDALDDFLGLLWSTLLSFSLPQVMEDEFLKGFCLFVSFIFVFKKRTLINVSTKLLENFWNLGGWRSDGLWSSNKVGTHYSFFMYIFEGK